MALQYQKTILGPISTAANANSPAVDTQNIYSVSAQVIATGSPTGTVKIQASNDTPIGQAGFNGQTWTPTNWTDISGATVSVSAAGTFLIPKTDVCYTFIRFVYTGTGTGSVTVNIKTLGY